jgi:hypothetical protein
LKNITEKPNGWKLLYEIWQTTPDNLDDQIDSCNRIAKLLTEQNAQFGARFYGFFLSQKDSNLYPSYLENEFKLLKESVGGNRWAGLSIGQKYAYFTATCYQ